MNFLGFGSKTSSYEGSIADKTNFSGTAFGHGPPMPGALRGTSHDLFQDVQFFVFTKASGLLGRMIGRNLKLRVDRFVIDYSREPSASNEVRIGKVICPANSILAMSEVDNNKFDRIPLTYAECVKVDRRVDHQFLESSKYPTIVYEVQSENRHELVGTLSCHGSAQLVKCTKEDQGAELVVTCPIIQSQFGITPFSALFGLIAIEDKVELQIRVPSKLL